MRTLFVISPPKKITSCLHEIPLTLIGFAGVIVQNLIDDNDNNDADDHDDSNDNNANNDEKNDNNDDDDDNDDETRGCDCLYGFHVSVGVRSFGDCLPFPYLVLLCFPPSRFDVGLGWDGGGTGVIDRLARGCRTHWVASVIHPSLYVCMQRFTYREFPMPN